MSTSTQPTYPKRLTHPWWQTEAIYEIYMWSFCDANGDGIGDLAGITGRLEYLSWVGVGGVWLTPFFPSPMIDFGYDISDYCNVDPRFGTLADFDTLITEAHNLNLKIIIDFVPNHTSDQHSWFQEARSSKQNPRRDWYTWADPAVDGSPPNNWQSRFGGGPAWTLDEKTGQYYLHSFLPEQPDLNWREPEVRQAMTDVLHFWLRRGVDGIRVDVCDRILKDPLLRDNPPNPKWTLAMDPAQRLTQTNSKNLPEVADINRLFRTVTDRYNDAVLIGESYLSPKELVAYYNNGEGYHLPFNFSLIFADLVPPTIKKIIEEYEAVLPKGAWPNWVLGNHDRPRIASRIGKERSRLAMLLLLTLRGTPTIYYGDEIGLTDVAIPREKLADPWGLATPERARDKVRTPMQWTSLPGHGFCRPDVEPWLPFSDDAYDRNIAEQRNDPQSELEITRRLLLLRREHPCLALGAIELLDTDSDCLRYRRYDDHETYIVECNFSDHDVPLTQKGVVETIFSTHRASDANGLPPFAGHILRVVK